MHLAFLYVAVILFVLDALAGAFPNVPPWSRALLGLGLAFFAASFIVST